MKKVLSLGILGQVMRIMVDGNIDKEPKKQIVQRTCFTDLAPCDDVDLKAYSEALDHAFGSPNARNVAVSGPYASGKSTIVKTYIKKHEGLSPMTISLAHFGDAESSLDPRQLSDKLESEIINQIVQRTPSCRIRDSRFHRMEEPNSKTIKLYVALIVAVSAFVCGFIFRHRIADSIFSELHFCNIMPSSLIGGFCILGIMAIGAYFLYQLIRLLYRRREVKRISLPGNFSVEVGSLYEANNKDADSSFFDRYLSEILYLFQKCGTHIFVFEDIDRFDGVEIFTQLRKLNILLNDACPEESSEPFRFFYLVKDSVFENEERTKFFDFIVPIIPYVSTSNAYEVLKKKIKTRFFDNELSLSDSFVKRMSVNLGDPRMMGNVINELYIYKKNLSDNPELSHEKLFAMVMYKNFFPEDYELLVNRNGLVYEVFSNCKPRIIQKASLEIDEQIKRLEDEKSETSEQHLRELADLDMQALDPEEWDDIESLGALGDWDAMDFYVQGRKTQNTAYLEHVKEMREKNSDYDKAVSAADASHRKKHSSLNTGLKELSVRRDKLGRLRLSEMLDQTENSVLLEGEMEESIKALELSCIKSGEGPKGKTDIGFGATDATRWRRGKWGFLFDLIANGDLDEDYQNYMNYFYEGELTRNDIGFITRVHNREAFIPDYHIDNPALVDEYLNDHDASMEAALNYDYFAFLFEVERADLRRKQKSLIQGICSRSKSGFAAQAIRRVDNITLVASVVAELDARLLLLLINDGNVSEGDVFRLALPVLQDDSFEASFLFMDSADRETITNWLNSSTLIFEEDYNDVEKAIEALKSIDFRATDLSAGKNERFRKRVYEEGLYSLNSNNVAYAISRYYASSKPVEWGNALSRVLREPDQNLAYKARASLGSMVQLILQNASEITDGEDTVLLVLNDAKIPLDEKHGYAARIKDPLCDLKKVDRRLYEFLIKMGKVRFSPNNLDAVYTTDDGITDSVSLFLKRAGSELSKSPDKKVPEDGQIENDLLMCEVIEQGKKLDEDGVRFALSSLRGELFAEDIGGKDAVPAWAIRLLVDMKKLAFDQEGLDFVASRVPDKLQLFVSHHYSTAKEGLEEGTIVFGENILPSLLSDEVLSSEQQKLIVAKTAGSVSLVETKPKEEVAYYLFEKNRYLDSLADLTSYYPEVGKSVQEVLLKYFALHISDIAEAGLIVDRDLLEQLIDSVEEKWQTKLELIVANLEQLNMQDLIDLASKAGYPKTISVLQGKNPTVEQSSIRVELVDALVKKGWVSSYRKNDAAKTMTLYCKRRISD